MDHKCQMSLMGQKSQLGLKGQMCQWSQMGQGLVDVEGLSLIRFDSAKI